MATTRLREKSPKKTPPSNPEIGSPVTRSTRLKAKKLKSDIEDDGDEAEYGPLNVLAQVATEKLEKEPKRSSSGTKRDAKDFSSLRLISKLTKRSIQSLEELDLDQITRLSDKCLLSFFAEFSANEMTRNFIYSCQLMPKKCKETFKSFGNETQARLKIKAHLNDHIKQLTEEAADADKKAPKFTAEPLHIRNKRLAEMTGKPKKKAAGTFNIANVLLGTSVNKKSNFTSLKTNQSSEDTGNDEMIDNTVPTIKTELDSEDEKLELSDEQSEKLFGDENGNDVTKRHENKKTNVNKVKKKSGPKSSKLQINLGINTQKDRSDSENKRILAKRKKTSKKKLDLYVSTDEESDSSLQDETERRIEENEQFIIDLLSRTQPHHDHCYTTIFGKKKGIESFDLVDESDDVENDSVDGDNIHYQGREIIYPKRKAEPILCLGNVSVMDELTGTGSDEASKTIIVCSEEILDDESEDETDGHSGLRPYPPMPKLLVTKRGRIAYPEEDEPASEEEEQVVTPKKRKKGSGGETTGSADWERRTALKCIRELKSRKAKEDALLFCRICKDKKFTASATLMYHYRSHAGIKPFVCLICNTTFTRQHSLNYHMLIHNNQSRFTCKDCGRKFRHPSHFKEHLRRHTGETPFICMDCPQKFKTRNTYKRHLKTRHGKLLTAAGIRMLSVEEFAVIRTKPYRRTPDRSLKNKNRNVKGTAGTDGQINVFDDFESDNSSSGNNVSVIERMEIHDHQLHVGEHFDMDDNNVITAIEDDVQEVPVLQNQLFVPVRVIVNS